MISCPRISHVSLLIHLIFAFSTFEKPNFCMFPIMYLNIVRNQRWWCTYILSIAESLHFRILFLTRVIYLIFAFPIFWLTWFLHVYCHVLKYCLKRMLVMYLYIVICWITYFSHIICHTSDVPNFCIYNILINLIFACLLSCT